MRMGGHSHTTRTHTLVDITGMFLIFFFVGERAKGKEGSVIADTLTRKSSFASRE